MAIDTDIQSFTEYNNNCNDENTKINQLVPLVQNTALSATDTNKVVVRRSGVWAVQGQDAYNGHIQNFGNIAGEVALGLNSTSCRTAMLATVTGYTFITGFTNILSGWVYHLFIKQDATGGHNVRWPYGASVLNMIGTDPNQITEVYVVKMPNGNLFIKCGAFQNTVTLGEVIKEFEVPSITFPDGSQAPMSFTWSKAAAISHGGTLTDLYSDWEIAADDLYTVLLFSSYNNTIDIASIQVVLTQAGAAYMRTRYGGNIDGVPVLSPWDEAYVEFSGIDGDRYWDQTVLCINADKYGWEGSKKIVDEKGFNSLTVYGDTKITDVFGQWAVNFDGSGDYLTFFGNSLSLGLLDFTIEIFFSANNVTSDGFNFFDTRISTYDTSGFAFYVRSNQKLTFGYPSNGTTWSAYEGSSLIPSNTLYHAALCRTGNTIKWYLNGSLEGSTSCSNNFTRNSFRFGQNWEAVGDGGGKIYSVRITKNIARYTSDFEVDLTDPYFKTGNLWWTPEPKEIATENFVDSENWDRNLLLINGNSSSIRDEFGKTITLYGNAAKVIENNFGSIDFDGSGDYLSVPYDGTLSFLDKDFTIECFVSVTSNTLIPLFCNIASTSSDDNRIIFGYWSGYWQFFVRTTSNLVNFSTLYATSLTVGTINHVALVRSGSTFTLYINGTSVGTGSYAGAMPVINGLTYIGNIRLSSVFTNYLSGNIFSYRISDFARYTSNFTVDLTMPYFPTKPKVENWAETSLVVNAYNLPVNSTDIRDAKGNAVSVYGDAKVGVDSNGLQYINFDGTGDYLRSTADTNFLGSDFTLEWFISRTSTTASGNIFCNRGSATNTGILIGFSNTSPYNLFVYIGNGSWFFSQNYSITADTNLFHLAVVRYSGNIYVYVNGILFASNAISGTISVTAGYTTICADLGNTGNNFYPFNGKLYSFRATSKALYTSNFNVDLTNPYFPAIDSISDLWIDANDYSKITLDTGVSKIVDKSGNMREAVQDTATAQPALVQNAQNGLMALSFDGDDNLSVSDNVSLQFGTSDFAVLAIVNFVNVSKGEAEQNTVVSKNYTGFELQNYQGVVGCYAGGSSNASNLSGLVSGKSHIIGGVRSGGTLYSYLDEISSVGTSNSASVSNAGQDILIGYRPGSDSRTRMIGKIYEVIILSKFSAWVLKKFGGYLAHKWGLTDNLPVNHPYKTGFPTEDSRTDDYWYATVLCINGTDIIRPTEIIDSSRNSKLYITGNTKALINSENKSYIDFDGASSVWVSETTTYEYAGDFTEEYFLEFGSNSGDCAIHTHINNSADYWSGGRLFYSNGSLYYYMGVMGIWNFQKTVKTGLLLNTLYHIAVVRLSGVIYFYINGVLEGSQVFASTTGQSGMCFGKSYTDSSNSYAWKLYSVRITKGVARYTENFEVDLTNPYFPKNTPFICNKNGVIDGILYNGTKTITKVLGSAGNVGVWVDVPSGGKFIIYSGGYFYFNTDGDFDYLYGQEKSISSINYHVSDGVAEDGGTLTVTVGAAAAALWSPAEITTAQWLDYGDDETLTWSTGLSVFSDKSGNGRDAVMETASAQPVDNSGMLQFTTDHYMTHSVPQSLPCHVFFVADLSAMGAGALALIDRVTTTAPYPPGIYAGGSSNYNPNVYWGSAWTGNGGFGVINTGLLIFECVLTTQHVQFRKNGGTLYGVVNSNSVLSTWTSISTAYSAQRVAHKLGERIIVNSAVGETERQKVEGYLAHKWDALLGVTTLVNALPSDHPYKSAAPTI